MTRAGPWVAIHGAECIVGSSCGPASVNHPKRRVDSTFHLICRQTDRRDLFLGDDEQLVTACDFGYIHVATQAGRLKVFRIARVTAY